MTLFLGDLKREDLSGKTVLVRVDYNVPLKKDDTSNTMIPTDTSRVRASLPSLEFLLRNGAKVVLCSHLDRPRGPDPSLSLRLLVKPLQEMVKEFSASVKFVKECIGAEVDKAKQELRAGEILLLENLRFHSEEMSNDPTFSEHLASHIDIYVNDAFGAAHRAHASTVGVTQFIPTRCAGFLMKKELDFLGEALNQPRRPLVAIVGGAKISSKLGVLKNLLQKVNVLLIGGGMVYTFYRAMGHSVGDSLVQEEFISHAAEVLKMTEELRVRLVLSCDSHIVPTASLKQPNQSQQEQKASHQVQDPLDLPSNTASLAVEYSTHTPDKEGLEFEPAVSVANTPLGPLYVPLTSQMKRVEKNECISEGWTGVDIGPESIRTFCSALELTRTVLWNGPLGMCENEEYAHGTISLLHFVSDLTDAGSTTILCGGDTVAALEHLQWRLAHPEVLPGETEPLLPTQLHFSHVSTGGGAALEFLEGKTLPGVAALSTAQL
eukprot:gene18501-21061_t